MKMRNHSLGLIRMKIFGHPLTKQLIAEQVQPLRILFYVYLVSFTAGYFIPEFHLNRDASQFIFDNVLILILANIPFVIFIEYDKLSKKGWISASLWILLFFISLIGVEFVGVAVHTQTSFHDQHDPDVIYWNGIALIFSGIVGFVLTITNYIGEKLDKKITLTRRQQKIILFFLLFIVILLNIYSMQVNPQWENFFNYLQTLI